MTSNQYDRPPEMAIDTAKNYQAIIEMEKGGTITIDLLAKEAPVTVNNFVFLAKDGYYDGITFHRVIPGFMAQSGDPTGTFTSFQFHRNFCVMRRLITAVLWLRRVWGRMETGPSPRRAL